MQLSDLVGEHLLDAVDESVEKIHQYGEHYEDCNTIRFRLDGIPYAAVEDPDDGYRSCMRDLVISEGLMVNVFPPVRVVGRHRTKGEYGGVDDVLELVSVVTGKVVLEVGTDNTDDYYPGFVGRFDPSAIGEATP